jgi:hypothetical protein
MKDRYTFAGRDTRSLRSKLCERNFMSNFIPS